MDVEGHEGHVLRGATLLQAQVPYLVFEFNSCLGQECWIQRSRGHTDELQVEFGYHFSFDSFYGKSFDPLVHHIACRSCYARK